MTTFNEQATQKAATEERDLAKEANEVYARLDENPHMGIVLDPELADFLGAFDEQDFPEDLALIDDILNQADTGGKFNE